MGNKRSKRKTVSPSQDDDEYELMHLNSDDETIGSDASILKEVHPSCEVEGKSLKKKVKNAIVGERQRKKVDKGCSKSKYRVAAINTRCSPKRLRTIFDTCLNPDQERVVAELGFGGLLEIKIKTLNRCMALELVNAFDLVDNKIHCKGQSIPVTYHDISLLFGLPETGRRFPTKISNEQKAMVNEFRGLTESGLERIIKEGGTDDRFKRAFILLVLSTFLCPITKCGPSPKLLSTIIDVEQAQQYNWSKLVFDWLIEGIEAFKQNPTTKRRVNGCIFFIKMWYIHSKYGSPTSIEDPPLIKHWDDESLHSCMKQERKKLQGMLNCKLRTQNKDFKELVKPIFEEERYRNLAASLLWQIKTFEDENKVARKIKKQSMTKDNDAGEVDVRDYEGEDVNVRDNEGGDVKLGEVEIKDTETVDIDARDVELVDNLKSDDMIGFDPNNNGVPSNTAEHLPILPVKIAQKVFISCTRKPSARTTRGAKIFDGEEELINIRGNSLCRNDACSLAPRHRISNMVIMFAGLYINEKQKVMETPSRYCLHYVLAHSISLGLQNYKRGNIEKWDTLDKWWPNMDISLIRKSKWIFVPMLYDDHWWCYALDHVQRTLFVLDSLNNEHDGAQLMLDKLTAIRLKEMLAKLGGQWRSTTDLKIVNVDLPRQTNGVDCGLYTIKYMELWDGLGMPTWDNEYCQNLRRDLLLRWIMDEENEVKSDVLKGAGVELTCVKDDPIPDLEIIPEVTTDPSSTIASRIKATETCRSRILGPKGKSPFVAYYTRKRAKMDS